MQQERKRLKVDGTNDCPWSPVPVLSDETTQPIELVDVYAAAIVDPKETSTLLRCLGEHFPLTELHHLKRVQSYRGGQSGKVLQIILCAAKDIEGSPEDINLDVIFEDRSISRTGLSPPFLTKVSKYPPKTRQQFEEASKYWATAFHESKRLTKAIEGQLFTTSEKYLIKKYMTMAIEMAHFGKTRGMKPIGAVIVDPSSDEVIAKCYDLRCSNRHPLFHAVMVCIDLVAATQGAGAYKYKEAGFHWKSCDNCSGLNDEGLVSGESSNAEKEIDDDKVNTTLQTENEFQKNTKLKVAQPSPTATNLAALPYLCTGYDLYVTKEPCVIIHRVFYGSRHVDGALGSAYKIHIQPGLNHHFEVFRGILEKECLQLDDS
ncbi:putative inactive tRNA-specific adenosine deaminase-like protein 3 isoform X2 [Glandiceps talaboti]